MTLDELELRLLRFRQSVVSEVAASMGPIGEEVESRLRTRVTHEFQEKTSYVHDPNRIKSYPPGTKGFFSRKSPAFGRPWIGQVQRYRYPAHILEQELTSVASLDRTTNRACVEVGYHKGIGEPGTATRYISWVHRGTIKMRPRPYLLIMLLDYRDRFVQRVNAAFRRAILRG